MNTVALKLIDNDDATGAAMTWRGGKGSFLVHADTWNSATVTLQVLGPDGSTWIDVGTDTTLTAGDLSLLVGQLQGGFREVKQMLIDQNQQHVRDKEEAKADRERRHSENKAEMQSLRTAMDSTAAVAQENRRWIVEKGEPLLGRVEKLEGASQAEMNAKAAEDGEKRGFLKTWGLLVAVASGLAVFLGWLGADKLSALLFRLAVMLGGGHA